MKNPRVKTLFDRWRKVWLLSVDRNRKLREMLDRLREVDKTNKLEMIKNKISYLN